MTVAELRRLLGQCRQELPITLALEGRDDECAVTVLRYRDDPPRLVVAARDMGPMPHAGRQDRPSGSPSSPPSPSG